MTQIPIDIRSVLICALIAGFGALDVDDRAPWKTPETGSVLWVYPAMSVTASRPPSGAAATAPFTALEAGDQVCLAFPAFGARFFLTPLVTWIFGVTRLATTLISS